jgi:hypothetical protein
MSVLAAATDALRRTQDRARLSKQLAEPGLGWWPAGAAAAMPPKEGLPTVFRRVAAIVGWGTCCCRPAFYRALCLVQTAAGGLQAAWLSSRGVGQLAYHTNHSGLPRSFLPPILVILGQGLASLPSNGSCCVLMYSMLCELLYVLENDASSTKQVQ